MTPWPDRRPVALLTVIAILALSVLAVPVAGTIDGGQSPPAGADTAVDVSSWNVTVWTGAPTVRQRLTDRAAIERATRDGTLTRNRTATPAHTLVVELSAPELDGRLVDAPGSNETTRFFGATHGPDSVFVLEQQNPTTMRQPLAAPLNDTGATRVVTDGRNDTYYLVVDPSALEYHRETGRVTLFQTQRQWDLHGDEVLGLAVRFEGDYREFGEWPDGDDDFVRFRRVELSSPDTSRWSLTFQSAAAQRVRFRGTVPAGTTATVRIEDRTDDGPPLERAVTFRRPGAANATRGQTVAATTFDLGNVSAGVGFDLVVRRGSWSIGRWPGATEPDSPHITAETQYDWQPEEDWGNGRIEVRCVSLPRRAHVVVGPGRWGGFDGSDWYPEGKAATAYEAGTYRNLTVEFHPDWGWEGAEYATVVAAVDGDGDGEIRSSDDYPLVVNGTVVAETVRLTNGSAGERVQSAGRGERAVSVGRDGQCAPAQTPDARDQQVGTTTRPTPAAETEAGSESVPSDRRTPTTTSGVGPGFGAVAGAVGVLLASLVGSLLGARSREN